MEQSILLASSLLEIGMPYLACWLPEPKHRRKWVEVDEEIVDIHIDEFTEGDIQVARTELDEISDGLHWREDENMFRRDGWWGITAYCYPRLEGNFNSTNIQAMGTMDEECRNAGHRRRQSSIGIASQYVDTLLESDKESEQHLCAAFHLAVTLVHEIAHLVYWQNFKHVFGGGGVEPSVDGQPVQELGLAFTGWIFGGWNPEPIMENEYDGTLFNGGMQWIPQLQRQRRSAWKMSYSMPFSYIQGLMSQSIWNGLKGKLLSEAARAAIRAPSPFRYGIDARKAECQKYYVGNGIWKWKGPPPFNTIYEPAEDDFFEDEEGLYGEGFAIPSFEPNEPQSELDDSLKFGRPEQLLYRRSRIPPFGFLDQDWITGPGFTEAPSNAQNPQHEQQTQSQEDPRPSGSNIVNIKIIYSGIYDEVSKTVQKFSNSLKRDRDTRNQSVRQEPSKKQKQLDYTNWSEGVLRNLCAERDLSCFGDKSVLIARLGQFDAIESEFSVANSGGKPEEARESVNPAGSFMIRALWSTRIERLTKAIERETGIPVGLQRLQLGGPDGFAIEDLERLFPYDIELQNYGKGFWDTVLLYRIQRAGQPDPGPRPPSPNHLNLTPRVTSQLPRPNVPYYILNLGQLPHVRASAIPIPQANWQRRAQELRDAVRRLEDDNRLLRRALANRNRELAEDEFVHYISLLDQINQVLHSKTANLQQ